MSSSTRCAACRASGQVGAAHGVPSAAARPRGRAAARATRSADGARTIGTASAATPSPRSRMCAHVPLAARDARLLCVVETPADQAVMERAGMLPGPVLRADGPAVAARRHRAASDIRLDRLLERAADGVVQRGDHRDQLHRRRRGDGALHRRGAAARRPEGHAPRARRAGRQRARARRQRHARAGRHRAPRDPMAERKATKRARSRTKRPLRSPARKTATGLAQNRRPHRNLAWLQSVQAASIGPG